jgi:hypothetical protein
MAKAKNPPEQNASSKSAAKGKKSPAGKAAAKTPSKAVAAAAGPGGGGSTPGPQPSLTELQDEIRLRAYQIYCERGGEHGLHHADWHRAELEVRAKYEKYGT